MACATLKRSCQWDPLHSPNGRSAKRRRCTPMVISPSSVVKSQGKLEPSPFQEVSPKLTSEQISLNITMELKRLQRRKQLQSASPLERSPNPGSPSSTSTSGLSSPSRREDQPLFTFRHVNLICERMLSERENQIKEAYDRVLTCKLAEQYDTFVKFTHDQIQKRFDHGTPPSYLS